MGQIKNIKLHIVTDIKLHNNMATVAAATNNYTGAPRKPEYSDEETQREFEAWLLTKGYVSHKEYCDCDSCKEDGLYQYGQDCLALEEVHRKADQIIKELEALPKSVSEILTRI